MGWFDIAKSIVDALGKLPKNTDANNTPPVDVPGQVITNSPYTFYIADLAEKYETSNKGPGFISNGSKWGDPGGDSYGSYQIETKKGTMQDYLKRTNDMFTQSLNLYTVNSPQFKQKWRDLATNFPDQFQQSQFDFLCNKPGGYNDAIKYAKQLGWRVDSFALQSAIFSTSNQSGGWRTGIFAKSGISPSDPLVLQINKLYDARARYFLNLSSLTNTIKSSIMQQRCGRTVDMKVYNKGNERADCLKLIQG